MLLKRDVPAPSLPEQTVPVPELSGDVLVRGLLLKDRLELAILEGYGRMSGMLAASVFVTGTNGEMVPLYTADEWERWGAKHYAAALKLWDVSRRLSDMGGEEAEKNSQAQNSDSPAVSQ